MVDRSAVGFRGERFPFPLERGKVRELARSVFSQQAAYLDDESPPIPPTFLKQAQFYWEPPEASVVERCGFDRGNPPLHAEQEFVFHGPPPRTGQVLTAQSVVERIDDKPSRTYGTLTYVVLTTEFRDDTGRLVAETRSTSVVRPNRESGS
jgi:hypothetical protein